MPEKILYMLGAGASANVLPLARNIYYDNREIRKPGLVEEIKRFDVKSWFLDYDLDLDLSKLVETIKTRLVSIAEKAEKFGDVDTYAKFLHIMNSGGDDFQKVKQGLSEYFALKQILLNEKDNRYLPWLVSIMEKKMFPENVKILNWNYDFQVELAFSEFGFSEDVDHSGNGFGHSGLLLNYYPNLDPTFKDYQMLSLIHLNGIAGFIKQQTDFYTASIFQKKFMSSKNTALTFFQEHNYDPQINFAWEKGQYHSLLMEHVANMIQDATILVVIGYSFPFFNREIDKQIFEHLKAGHTLKKIYYQDPILTGKQLVSQFNLEKEEISIVHISQTENFHIPFEY